MHLPIRVVGRSQPVEVPFRLFTSFKFSVHVPGNGVVEFIADLDSGNALTAKVFQVEAPGKYVNDPVATLKAKQTADAILSAVLRRLGLVEVDGKRLIQEMPPSVLRWIATAHEAEKRTAEACRIALANLEPVWRDSTEPAPKVHVATDILDSYYQQVMDEVLGEWEDKAQREAAEYLTSHTTRGNSEVQP